MDEKKFNRIDCYIDEGVKYCWDEGVQDYLKDETYENVSPIIQKIQELEKRIVALETEVFNAPDIFSKVEIL